MLIEFFKILRCILFAISCWGWICFLYKNLKLKVEFVPTILVSIIGSVVFFAGILNVLVEVTICLFGVGLILGLAFLYKRDNIALLLSNSMLCLFIGVIFFLLLLYGEKFIAYDDFSHWGVVARLIIEENRFPNFQDNIISFQAYPLGSASVIYYVCKLTGIHSEWMMMFSQATIILCALISLFAFVRKKWQNIVVIITIILVLCANTRLNCLLVDTLLPVVGAAGFLICKYYSKQLEKKCFAILPIIIFLVSIKNSGLFFVALIEIYIIFSLYKERGIKDIKKAMMLLLAPLVTLVLWQKHVSLVFQNGLSSKHAFSVGNFETILGDKTKADILVIFDRFFDAVFSFNNGFAFYIALCVGIYLIYQYIKKQQKLRLVKRLIAYFAIYLLYQISLLATYFFSMPVEEAVKVAAYDRYHMTILIFLMMIVLPEIFMISFERAHFIILSVIVTSIFEFFILKPDFSILTGIDWKDSVRYEYEMVVQGKQIPYNSSYMFLLEKDDMGYAYYFFRYYYRTLNVAVYTEDQLPNIKDDLKNYEYLIILDDTEVITNYIKHDLQIYSDEKIISLNNSK